MLEGKLEEGGREGLKTCLESVPIASEGRTKWGECPCCKDRKGWIQLFAGCWMDELIWWMLGISFRC